jgi:hypothetical protein
MLNIQVLWDMMLFHWVSSSQYYEGLQSLQNAKYYLPSDKMSHRTSESSTQNQPTDYSGGKRIVLNSFSLCCQIMKVPSA